MMRSKSDEEFSREAMRLLDASLEQVSPQTLRRLQSARQQALSGKVRPHHRPWLAFPRWVTAGGLATVAVAVLTVSLWVAVPRQQPRVVDEELDRIATKEQMELYEDLEFFRWLAENK
jgi:hypothetical protein